MSYRAVRHHTGKVILSGAKLSSVVTKLDGVMVGFIIPGAFTGTAVTFRVCHRPDGVLGPINGQDETSYDNTPSTEGVFAGGTGHNIGDIITLSDGSTVEVDGETGNVVDEFTVTSTLSGGCYAGQTLTQVSTTGGGINFSLTPDTDNLVRGAWPVLYDSEGNVPSVTVSSSQGYSLTGGEADAIGPWPYFRFESQAAEGADREIIAVTV